MGACSCSSLEEESSRETDTEGEGVGRDSRDSRLMLDRFFNVLGEFIRLSIKEEELRKEKKKKEKN